MTKTAISFKVPEKLWDDFRKQTDQLFISRAPFLNYMVLREVRNLAEELAGLKLSLRAKRHISGKLKGLTTTSVNIEVEPATAEALRAVIRDHNLVRDAFMCRLIIFLRSTDALLEHLEVPRLAKSNWLDVDSDYMPASPLRTMEAVRDDPLFFIRNHLQASSQCGIYRVPLPPSLDWAACYLNDENVPGTSAKRKHEKLFQLLDLPASAKPFTRNSRGKTK